MEMKSAMTAPCMDKSVMRGYRKFDRQVSILSTEIFRLTRAMQQHPSEALFNATR